MGFGQKVWKARNAKLGGRCAQIVNWRVEGLFFYRGVWGHSPRKFLNSKTGSGACQCFLGHFSPIPIPPPKNISLQIYTDLKNSRMVLGNGKKSEIRLKSEDSVPWLSTPFKLKILCAVAEIPNQHFYKLSPSPSMFYFWVILNHINVKKNIFIRKIDVGSSKVIF